MQQTTRPPLGTTLLTYAGHYDHYYTVAWSPGGKNIVSVNSYHGAIELWDAATSQCLAVCPKLPMVHVAAWSPDGTYVALACHGRPGTVYVWHPQTNEIISTNQDGGHDSWSSSLGWSPDGTRIASSCQSSSHLKFENEEPLSARTTRERRARQRRRSMQRRQLLRQIPYDLHTIQVWDVQTGAGIYNYLGHTTTITGVAWSPDGRYIASASIDGLVLVWDAATAETITSFRRHPAGATAISWSPDSKYLASACLSEVLVWEALTGKIVTTCQHKASQEIRVAWSPDGKRLVSNAFDGIAVVWDAFSGEILCIYDEPTATGSDIAWSPDGQTIASTGQGIFLWDARSGETRLVRGEPSEVSNAKPSPDGKYVASAHSDPVQIWNAQTGKRVGTCGDYATCSLTSAFDWSPDSQHLVTAHIYGAIVVWKHVGESGHPSEIVVYQESGDPDDKANHAFARDIAWSPDGTRIACTRKDFIEIWDVATQERFLIYQGHAGLPKEEGRMDLVWSLSWSPDSRHIASCDELTVQIWDASSGVHLSSYEANNADIDRETLNSTWQPPGFRTVAWSPDGTSIAAAYASIIYVWNAESGQTTTIYRGHRQKVYPLAWSPDSTMIASAEEEGPEWVLAEHDGNDQSQSSPPLPASQTIHLWRVGQDEQKPYYLYQGHAYNERISAHIRDIRWFSDGERIVSANREVQIWQAR